MITDATIYEVINRIPKGSVIFYPSFPDTFSKLTKTLSVGTWKVEDNSTSMRTSTRREAVARVRVQINIWSLTPEMRMKTDAEVDAVMNSVFRRVSLTHIEDSISTGSKAYRTIAIYQGKIDTTSLLVY